MERFAHGARGAARQHTLRSSIGCVGVGLHSGEKVEMELGPAPAGSGIVFHRTDRDVTIPARHDRIIATRLATELASPEDPAIRVSTVEHLLAALAALGVDNARVEIDGPEVPVLDGSSAPFLFLLDCAGVVAQEAPRREITVLRPVHVGARDGFAELLPPHEEDGTGLEMSLSIAFPEPIIGREALSLALTEATFRHELAAARTFTTVDAIAGLRAAGLARGGTLENAIVVDHTRVLNPAGLRMPDEFVRHKLLDAVGDLSLAGMPIHGRFRGHRSGHTLNHRLLERLFASENAYRVTPTLAAPVEEELSLAAA